MSRRRALVAGVFAVIYPGLGHLYLREWLRALSWFGLAFLTAVLVVPVDVLTAYQTGGLSGLITASQNLPTAAVVALLLVRLLNVIDAIRLGLAPRRADQSDTGMTCPECGGEIDPQLDFCHWCTAKLDHPAEVQQRTTQGDGFFR